MITKLRAYKKKCGEHFWKGKRKTRGAG